MERFWPSTLNKVNITRERDSGSMAPPARQPHCFINFGAGPLFPSIRRLVMWCTALRGGGPLGGGSGPPKGGGGGSEGAKTKGGEGGGGGGADTGPGQKFVGGGGAFGQPPKVRFKRNPPGPAHS